MIPFDKITGRELAESLAGRDGDERLVIEARRPAADMWLIRVEHDLARSTAGQVARQIFDQSDGDGDGVWTVSDRFAARLVAALSSGDSERLLELIAEHTRATNHRNTDK